MEEFLKDYGYWITGIFVFGKSLPLLGGFVSGNTVLYLSGLFAGLGEFKLGFVFAVGFVAVLVGDSLMFVAGKYFSDKFPKLQKAQDKIQPWLESTHAGDNKTAYWYMHSGAIRPYLPFILGYSKMSNADWLQKVTTASVFFVPVVAGLGYFVGRLDASNSTKTIISGGLWVLASVIVAKMSHQLYKVIKN